MSLLLKSGQNGSKKRYVSLCDVVNKNEIIVYYRSKAQSKKDLNWFYQSNVVCIHPHVGTGVGKENLEVYYLFLESSHPSWPCMCDVCLGLPLKLHTRIMDFLFFQILSWAKCEMFFIRLL